MTKKGLFSSCSKLFTAWALCFLLSGCAPKQVVQEPDIPVFQYEQYVHNEGFRGKFASETHDVITLTPDRKSTDSTFKWTGEILGRLTGEKRRTNIVRLDRDLVWDIEPKKKRYLEYPIKKTAMQFDLFVDDPNGEKVYVEDCTKCETAVKRSGNKKIVNGYEAEQVILTLKCKENKQHGEAPETTTAKLEIWIAPGVKLSPEMDKFNEAFARKTGMNIHAQISQTLGDDLLKAFPFVRNLTLMMKDLKGYPILSTLTIENDQYLKKAEAERKKTSESDTKSGLSTSPTDMVTGFLGKKMKERQDTKQKEEDMKWGNIIWRISWEARNFKNISVTASIFNLPDGFKQVEQKEYLEGEQGKAVVEHKPAHYVHTACLSALTDTELGIPIYPGAKVDRAEPYDETNRNTNWYFNRKDDYRVRYVTAQPMDKVVSFYEGKLKTKCRINSRKEDGQDYKEALCNVPAGKGLIRTFRMDEKPVEISMGSVNIEEAASAAKSEQKLLPFELSIQKAPK